MSTSDEIRDVKRPYRKKAFQTGYAQSGSAVHNPAYGSGTVQTTPTAYRGPAQVVRPGVDPRTYVRPVAGGAGYNYPLDGSNYPWSITPKPDSSNVIQRQLVTFSALDSETGGVITANSGLLDDFYVDVAVVNVAAGATGDQTWHAPPAAITGTEAVARALTGSVIPYGPPRVPSDTTNMSAQPQASTSPYPNTSTSTAGVSGTIQNRSTGELYQIIGFGHTEATTTAGITYQIWVDGVLLMEWVDFQWAPVSPQADMWRYECPITVESQITFRVINRTGGTINTGTCEACFFGWSEQRDGYTDMATQKIENV